MPDIVPDDQWLAKEHALCLFRRDLMAGETDVRIILAEIGARAINSVK